jgi:hypothetical protein
MTQWLLLQNFRENFLFFGCFATWNHTADFVFNLHGRQCTTHCSTMYVTPGSPRNICKHKLIVIVFVVSFLWLETVLCIVDISVRIRIRILGSVPFPNGSRSGFTSGSGSFFFRQRPTKNIFFSKFFCLLLFEGTFTSVFKVKKVKKN